MKYKTKKKIAVFIMIVMILAVVSLFVVGLSSSARADDGGWKVRINDPCNHTTALAFAKGTVENYWVGSSGNMICVELTDGREFMTHWCNVLLYKD